MHVLLHHTYKAKINTGGLYNSCGLFKGVDNVIINYYYTVCHAAINAILNKNAENLSGCTLYTTLFPSHEDAKMIIQAGIQHVIYYEDKYHDKAFSAIARKLFMKAKVWYTRYDDHYN